MKEYTISVDGRYFVGETMRPMAGHSIAPTGFFQMVGDNTMTAYEYSDRFVDASKMILYNATGYLAGIYERTRYLPDGEKPHRIEIVACGEAPQDGQDGQDGQRGVTCTNT